MKASEGLIRQVHDLAAELVQAVASAESLRSLAIAQIEARRRVAVDEMRQKHDRAIAQVMDELRHITEQCGLSAAAWDDPIWMRFTTWPDITPSPVTRVGTLTIEGSTTSICTPALVPIVGGRNLIIKAKGGAKQEAARALQSVVLRLLATVPPAKLRILFIDPVGLGQNAADFMELADYVEELVGGMAQSEPTRIGHELADLSDHMAMVIQKYLRGRYQSIEEYNAEAGEVAEPYRLVSVFNFPINFTDESARRLVSIAENGPQCGVFVLATIDADQQLPYGFNPADLERQATVLTHDETRFVWAETALQDARLALDTPPPADLFRRIIDAVGSKSVEATRVEVPFQRIMPARDQWWKGDTLRAITVPIGRAGAAKLLNLELGRETAQHALLAGRTASGKSTLLHVLITNLALTYPPDELELYLVDFKKGVEFKDYASFGLPHARVVAIETDREFGLSVLQRLDEELKRRGEMLRGASCDNLRQYRERTGQRMPRILLLVDEFQEFFTEDDSLASRSALLLDRLARQGRAFGIHLLLGSQTLAGAYALARSTMEQMAVRIALQCGEDDSRMILGEDNTAARLLSRPGEAIYNSSAGLPEANRLFQVAWLPDEEKESLLERIRGLASETSQELPPAVVFEGHEMAKPEENSLIERLLGAATWPQDVRSVSAWLGAPVAIKDPTAARFRRQSGSNLLIIGRDEEAAVGMLSMAMISIALQRTPQDGRFYVVDLATGDTPWAGFAGALADVLPHAIEAGGRRDVATTLEKVESLTRSRVNSEQSDRSSIYLALLGLHRARDLRQEESYSYSPTDEDAPRSPARLLATVLREGPEVGVHVLGWCDSVSNLERALDRRGLNEFGMRVALPMAVEDSLRLVDDPAAAKLGPHRAIFWDEELVGQVEKFRPYGIPSREWLEQVGHALRQRR